MPEQNLVRPLMKNLSVSKIESYLLCGKNFEYTHIHKIQQPKSGKAVAGNVVHHIIELAIREFARTGTYPDAMSMDDLYEPTWESKFQEESEKPWFNGWQWDEDDPPEKVKAEYRPLVRLAREEVLPTIDPWTIDGQPVVEHKIELELSSKIGPFKIIGYADLLRRNGESGVLCDWKNTKEKVSPRAKRTWLQFGCYSLAMWPMVGEENLQCEKIFLVRDKEKPFVERVPFVVGEMHRKYFVEIAARVWEAIHQGLFFPQTDSWLCKPEFCAFHPGCQGCLLKSESEAK